MTAKQPGTKGGHVDAAAGHAHDMRVPRGLLLGIGALVLFALSVTAVSRLTGFGASRVSTPEVTTSLSVRFVDQEDGLVEALAADSGRVLARWGKGEGGFVRVTLRGLARERRALGVGAQPPFVLARDAGGRLFLSDPETGHRVTLDAFGRDNAAQFAALIETAAADGGRS